MGAVVLLAAAACYRVFVATAPGDSLTAYSSLQKRATLLGEESDLVKRDAMCFPFSGIGRSIDAQLPTNARVFLTDMLGPENSGRLGYYYFLTYYLFPREVAISLDEQPTYALTGMLGRNPRSDEELKQAGFDLALQVTKDGLHHKVLRPLAPRPPESKAPPAPGRDRIIAFLLPLAVALSGRRLVRSLFKELDGVLSPGEWLASGLAVGAFFLTQLILALRMAGVRLEQGLALAIGIWAGCEAVLLARNLRVRPLQFRARQCWWLLLLPAGLMSWCLFRLAGVECLTDFDAVAFWVFKAKLLHSYAGSELLAWFKNTALGYAHLDYPLLVSLLHSFTYGALGHENEFVTKFWNQWMLLLLVWALLGAARFPNQRPWLIASALTTMVLLPMAVEYSRTEGAATPMLFYTCLASIQITLGMLDKQPGRLRLGLLLLMAAAMVKFDGMILLAVWCVLLLLDKDSRAILSSPRRLGWAALAGTAAWIPYFVFRLSGPVPHPESAWMRLLVNNAAAVLHILPTTWKALMSRRLLNHELASWMSPDNQSVVWNGRWMGWASLIDPATIGLAWVSLLLLIAACCHSGQLRWAASRLFFLFLAFSTAICVIWTAIHSSPPDYAAVLSVSGNTTGGRYVFPVLMSWFLGCALLFTRVEDLRGDSVRLQSRR